ncbi:MAG: restriction endonuclease [Bacteroidaceae bacterium]|nr:restriction endonuclease [Bacteroidales bacterium]MBR6032995.1 restriction endonuclease [Bacteroidaceae bacterium]
MSELLDIAIQTVKTAKTSFCRFITGNDAGTTGSHQSGFYIPKNAAPLLFGTECRRGENKEKWVTIKWQNDFETPSRFIYYGQGTRNEYRITRFGRKFEFLQDRYVGSLIIIAEQAEDYYQAFVLESEDDIESFLSYFNLSTEQTNQLIDLSQVQDVGDKLRLAIMEKIKDLQDFPMTREMGKMAQDIYNRLNNVTPEQIRKTPDKILINWYSAELDLFRSLEEKVYKPIYTQPFEDCQSLVDFSNKILNRRKSRAGKSLEHHLSAIFDAEELIFEEQAVTENNKKPDFLFPNGECYHNFEFPAEDLTVLGAKTTCKDRWRQVVTEADRVEEKYLFTLQPGISRNQLKEMADERVRLVVPEDHLETFPKEYQSSINTLGGFINIVKAKQERMPKHFIINQTNKFIFNGPVGQVVEHADNIDSTKEETKE